MAKKKRRKNKKLPYSGMLMLNGDPAIGINFFNRYFNDLIKKNDSDEPEAIPDEAFNTPIGDSSTDSVSSDAGGEAGGEGGAVGESIEFKKVKLNEFDDTQPLEEKRETKRYYIRPQHIFCANKLDVLKALIQVTEAGENCSVYTLKNLDDHDDVHKLTNNDIIYYYDNNVLYDKNHVMVMDYDLYIKHEEERPNLGKDPDKISKAEYHSEYDDRMTKETVLESLDLDINDDESITNFITQVDAGDEVSIGKRDNIEYFATKDSDGYVIFFITDETSEPEDYFICESSDDLINFIKRNFDFEDFEDEEDQKIDNYQLAQDIIYHNAVEGFSAKEVKEMIDNKDELIFWKLISHDHSELFDDEDEYLYYCKNHKDELFKCLDEIFEDEASRAFDDYDFDEGLTEAAHFEDSFENAYNHLNEFMIDDSFLITDLKNSTNISDAIDLLNQGINNWDLFYDYLPEDSDIEEFAQFIVDKNDFKSDKDDMWDFDESLTEAKRISDPNLKTGDIIEFQSKFDSNPTQIQIDSISDKWVYGHVLGSGERKVLYRDRSKLNKIKKNLYDGLEDSTNMQDLNEKVDKEWEPNYDNEYTFYVYDMWGGCSWELFTINEIKKYIKQLKKKEPDNSVAYIAVVNNYIDHEFESLEELIEFLKYYEEEYDFNESLNEDFDLDEDDIPTEFDDQMDFLAADEQEAIDGYEKVIDKVEDEHVQDQLAKIETEEKAHKDYLEKVKEDPTIDYEEPLMDEDELEEAYNSNESLNEETENEYPNICSICGEPYIGYGNNAEPYAHGRCCDACNFKFVIPERIRLMNLSSKTQESLNEETDFDLNNLNSLVGRKIKIIYMKDDWSGKDYDGREGTITKAALDPWGDLYYRGTWGDLAVYPSEDKIEFID